MSKIEYQSLRPGTIVRATRRMEFEDTVVRPGDMGVVVGPYGCYGKSRGPVIRWIEVYANKATINAIAELRHHSDVRVEAPAETGYLARLGKVKRVTADKLLEMKDKAKALLAVFQYAGKDVDYVSHIASRDLISMVDEILENR